LARKLSSSRSLPPAPTTAEAEHGAHDRGGLSVDLDRPDEGAVDLDLSNGKARRLESDEYPVPKWIAETFTATFTGRVQRAASH
jgi:hypothetical protein